MAWVYLSFTQGWRVLRGREGEREEEEGGGKRVKTEVAEGSAGSW